MDKHFYVYNECCISIVVHVSLTPPNNLAVVRAGESVQPGVQKLICTTDRDTLYTNSIAADGSARWGVRVIQLNAGEYTHVIACEGRAVDPDCHLPERWPLPTTRQQPDEDPANSFPPKQAQ